MRLIDADNIHYTRLLSQQGLDMELVPKVVIDNMPTIDAEPVRHGRWIKKEWEGYEPFYLCSECNKLHNQDYHYCNNCGAKMDGGQNEQ